jgi:RNA polymerase sigma-70 factor (ECF subfamily)
MATSAPDRCPRRPSHRRADQAPAGQPATPDDADLRRRFAAGEPDAMRELYARFAGPLLALSRSQLPDLEQARDAVQQTFLQAWRAACSYDAERPLAPWLFQICRRVCIDRYRRERTTPDRLDDHELHPALSVPGPSMERSWVVFQVRRAIDALPAEGRDIIRLMHLEGWTVEQVATRLDLPVGTVKSRSFRAHKRLLTSLAHLRAMEGEEVA